MLTSCLQSVRIILDYRPFVHLRNCRCTYDWIVGKDESSFEENQNKLNKLKHVYIIIAF